MLLGSSLGSILGKRRREPETEVQAPVPLTEEPAVEEVVEEEVDVQVDDGPIVVSKEPGPDDEEESDTDEESPSKRARVETPPVEEPPAPKARVVDWQTKNSRTPYKFRNGRKKYAGFRKEERGARFKDICPPSVFATLGVMKEQVNDIWVCKSWIPEGTALVRNYHVLGHSGKYYTTHIGRKPMCECPHFIKGNHCKHIIYIYLKVLNVPETSYIWYQRALTRRELRMVFNNAPDIEHDAPDHILTAYLWSLRIDDDNASKPTPEDNCIVCQSVPSEKEKSDLVYCECCGKAQHRACYLPWVEQVRKTHMKQLPYNRLHKLNCLNCGRRWLGPEGLEGYRKFKVTKAGYMNLAEVLDIDHKKRSKHYIAKRLAKYRRRWLDQQYYNMLGKARDPQFIKYRQIEVHMKRRADEDKRRQQVIDAAQEAAAKVNVLSMQPASLRRGKQAKKPAHTYDYRKAGEQKARLLNFAELQVKAQAASPEVFAGLAAPVNA